MLTELKNKGASEFTFQSGDIQISQCVLARLLPKRFTFQSGDIQISQPRL